MKANPSYKICALEKQHTRKDFSCGIDTLDDYLHQNIRQDIKRKSTAGYMLTELNSNVVIGYYTLSSSSIHISELAESVHKKLPRYPTLPTTLLGRLAVDKQHQGKYIGKLLLIDALKRSLSISEQIGSVAVIVEAINDAAVKFYKEHEFTQFRSDENKLYIPMKTVSQIWKG